MAINRSLMERQLYQQGGGAIYPRIDSLSSGISGAEQELQDILQSIDQVQSTLGAPSEGQGITVPFNTGVQAGTMNQSGTGMTTGIALNPGATIDPNLINDRPRPRGSTLSQLMGSDFSGGVGDPRTGAAFIPGNPLQEIMRNTKANGGMMNVSPRQQYGLGSLVKSITKGVKGAVSGVKDFVKSPLGLAALGIGGAGLFGMGPLSQLAGTKLGTTLAGLKSSPLFTGASKFFGGEKTLGKTAAMFGLGSLGSAALSAAGLDVDNPNEMPRDVESLKIYLADGYRKLNPGVEQDEVDAFVEANTREYAANGGRMGFAGGTEFEEYLKGREKFNKQQNYEQLYKEFLENKRRQKVAEQKTMAANGGRIGYAMGSAEENAIQASGIMGLPLNQNPAGVTELDLRETGGFIPPVGVKEKADDIPAMLANNEFVFTADAVRGMGNGDVNKGAQRMYDMMKKLEKGGRV
jgi:hypothetical protein